MKKLTVLIFIFSLLFPTLAFADQATISVSAAVPPNATDFQLSIQSNAASVVHQTTPITYQISYGSRLAYATPLTIVASWSQGTIDGQSSPSVDIADYVINSATNAYNSTAPVIDTTNRTITWTITSFPANTTNQKVSFQLKTNSDYTGPNSVTFTTTAQMAAAPDQTITTTYQFSTSTPSTGSGPSATPTPTQIPSSPAPQPTATASTGTMLRAPTPTPTSLTFPTFQNISITSLSSSQATILITTDQPATLFLAYGTVMERFNLPRRLAGTVPYGDLSTQHIITLSNLSPDTKYYFRITAKNQQGAVITSDIFTFTTAHISQPPQINLSSIIVTSEKILLFDPLENQHGELHNTVIIPIDTPYEFTFSLSNVSTKGISVYLKNKQVLGINTFEDLSLPNSNLTVSQIQPGVYQGRLKSPLTYGVYQLIARIFDTNGNISEVPIVDIRVVKQFTLYDKSSHNPIEHAQIQISRWNEQSQSFSAITPQMLAIPAPLYSNPDGTVPVVLPQGKYKADISANGYKETTVTFSLNPDSSHGYPTVYMEKSGLSLGGVIETAKNTLVYCTSATQSYFANIFTLHEVFQILAFLVLCMTVFLCVLSLSLRLGISPFLFPWYIWTRIRKAPKTVQPTQQLSQKETTMIIAEHILMRLIKHFLSVGFEFLLLLTLVCEILFGLYLGLYVVIPFLCISLINLIIWLIDIHAYR